MSPTLVTYVPRKTERDARATGLVTQTTTTASERKISEVFFWEKHMW